MQNIGVRCDRRAYPSFQRPSFCSGVKSSLLPNARATSMLLMDENVRAISNSSAPASTIQVQHNIELGPSWWGKQHHTSMNQDSGVRVHDICSQPLPNATGSTPSGICKLCKSQNKPTVR